MCDTGLTLNDAQTFTDMGYTFNKQIGSGSCGKVFLAEKKGTGRSGRKRYACKIINSNDAPKEFATKFLPRELDILSKVNHPDIVFIQGIYATENHILIFMQNAENGDLLEYILSEHEINEEIARTWSHQLTVAIEYLHKLHIAHRDIKCENVLITRNMNAKLADFGFARFVSTQKEKNLMSRTYCGSIAYAAPEVLRGRPYYPKIADIWSLGVVIYVLLNRSLPFPMDKLPPKAIYRMQKEKRWKFRAKAVEKFSQEAQRTVVSILEPDIRRRPTAEALLLANWFKIVDGNGTRKSIELTRHEKLAMESAVERVSLPESENVQAIPKKFDLLEVKNEPFPSEMVLRQSISSIRTHGIVEDVESVTSKALLLERTGTGKIDTSIVKNDEAGPMFETAATS